MPVWIKCCGMQHMAVLVTKKRHFMLRLMLHNRYQVIQSFSDRSTLTPRLCKAALRMAAHQIEEVSCPSTTVEASTIGVPSCNNIKSSSWKPLRAAHSRVCCLPIISARHPTSHLSLHARHRLYRWHQHNPKSEAASKSPEPQSSPQNMHHSKSRTNPHRRTAGKAHVSSSSGGQR